MEGIDVLENITPYVLPEPNILSVGGLLKKVSTFYAGLNPLLN